VIREHRSLSVFLSLCRNSYWDYVPVRRAGHYGRNDDGISGYCIPCVFLATLLQSATRLMVLPPETIKRAGHGFTSFLSA